MAIKNNGWYLVFKTGSMTTLYRTKQEQLRVAAQIVEGGGSSSELVNDRIRIDRYGEMEQDDITHGTIKASRSARYRAIFKPSGWVDGYEYDTYYVSDNGRLIPKR